MKYILQVNTGNIDTPNYKADEIINRLDYLANYLDISKIIFGWHNNYEENKKISEYLNSKNIESYFWLPVFAEIIDPSIEDNYFETSIFEKKISNLSEGDNFEFVCQSSNKNIEYIIKQFEEIKKDLKISGVFLDRIRYKSPALAKDAIYGCQCDECKKLYKNIEVDKDVYFKLLPNKINEGIYEYEDDNLNKLMKIKREIITDQVTKLYEYFKHNNLKVGLDTFALCIADFVGQDIISLGKCSDFIKPMYYLKTTAPAGIPFEFDGLPTKTIEAINNLWNNDLTSIEGSIKQCEYLMNRNVNITPGIDVNNIKNICNSNDEYVIEYLNRLKDIDCSEVVLSWDSMKISDSLLEKISKIK